MEVLVEMEVCFSSALHKALHVLRVHCRIHLQKPKQALEVGEAESMCTLQEVALQYQGRELLRTFHVEII